METTVKLFYTGKKYKFYTGIDENGRNFYNIIPLNGNKPTAGYYNSDWICKIKQVKNIFKS